MQDFLHVGPIRDDTVLNGVFQLVAGRSSTRSHRGASSAMAADLQGHRKSSATKANLFEQKHLSRPGILIRVQSEHQAPEYSSESK